MERDIKNRFILPIIDLLIIIFLLGSMTYFIVSARASSLAYPIAHDWTVEIYGDGGYDKLVDVDLSDYRLTRALGAVRQVTLSRDFSAEELSYGTLRMYLVAADVSVLIDGEEIDTTSEPLDEHLDDSRGYDFIELPHVEGAGRVSILVSSRDDGGLTAIPEIVLTSSDKSYAQFIHEDWPGILVGIFVFVFGIVVSALSLVFIHLNNDYARLLDLGIFSIFAGVWVMSSVNVPLIFGMNPEKNSAMGYVAISLAFLPLLSIDIRTRTGMSQRDRSIVKKTICVNIAVAVLLAVLHFTNIINYVSSVPVIHIMYVVNCLIILIVGVGHFRNMELDEKIYHVSFFVTILAGFVYMIVYYLRTYFRILPTNYTEFWFPTVTFVFIIVQIVSYLVHIYGMLMNQAEEEVLTRLAYNDALTGLYNRVHAEEEFKKLDEGTSDYALINIDLNGLKKINDERGHAQGDVFIASFGRILKEVFGEIGPCVRMGGDEFLVIVPANHVGRVDALLSAMEKKEAEASRHMPFDVDAAYGVAYSTEQPDSSAEQLYSIADQRMYEMKVASKKARED